MSSNKKRKKRKIIIFVIELLLLLVLLAVLFLWSKFQRIDHVQNIELVVMDGTNIADYMKYVKAE